MDLQKYCFRNGQIPGAVMYFLEDSVVKVISADNQMDKQYHVFHRLGVHGVKNKLQVNSTMFFIGSVSMVSRIDRKFYVHL